MLRVAGIALRDFQGHTRSDLRLGTLTLLRGANGSGKSSVRRALEWVLTGQVSDLGLSARGATEVLVRGYGTPEGAKKATVVVELTQGGKAMRESPKAFKARDPASGAVISEEKFREAHRFPPVEMVALACNPTSLVDLKPDALRDLLFAVMADGISRDEVLSALREWLSLRPEVSAELASSLQEYARRGLPELPSVRDLDRLYKEAYGARREANGAVRALKQQVEALRSAATTAARPNADDVDQVRASLFALREQVTAVHRRMTEQQEWANQRAVAEQALDDAQRHHADVLVKTGLTEADGHPGDEASLRGQIGTLAQQLRTVREQAGACPVYVGVACPLAPEAVQEHLTKLRQHRQKLVNELACTVVYEAAGKVRAAKAALDALPAAPPEMDGHGLEKLNQMVELETDRLQKLAARGGIREGAEETVARVKAQLSTAEAEATKLSLAVKCFDSDGIRVQLVGRRLVALQERINAGFTRLMGDGWFVHLDSGRENPMLIRHPGHGAAVLKSLSTAERTLVTVAIVDALNDFHELGLLCVDDLEHLTGRSREALLGALREWAASGRYGTILLAEADGSDPAAGLHVIDQV